MTDVSAPRTARERARVEVTLVDSDSGYRVGDASEVPDVFAEF